MVFTIYYCIMSTLIDPTDETVYLERRAKLSKLILVIKSKNYFYS